jgi:hypothetical protein
VGTSTKLYWVESRRWLSGSGNVRSSELSTHNSGLRGLCTPTYLDVDLVEKSDGLEKWNVSRPCQMLARQVLTYLLLRSALPDFQAPIKRNGIRRNGRYPLNTDSKLRMCTNLSLSLFANASFFFNSYFQKTK